MDTSVTLANWRTAPYSSQSFHHVDKLIPVSRIEGPAQAWPLAAHPQSLESLVFKDQRGQARQLPEVLDTTATRGLVVLQAGRLVAERYSRGYDGKTPHILFSISKSLTGALAGILVDQGMLDPESPVTRYVPEVADSAYGDCTVRQVLDMTVSSSFSEEYLDQAGDYIRYRRATLWDPALPGQDPGTLHGLLATLSRAPEPHGEVFNYLSPNSDFLGWIVERVSGQDLARFGEMMRLGGKDILPGWWVEDIRHGGDSSPWQKGDMVHLFPQGRYRSKWYQTGNASGAFCGIGIHGQWLWIDPRREVVIAKVSAQQEPVDDDTDMLLILAFEAIADAVRSPIP